MDWRRARLEESIGGGISIFSLMIARCGRSLAAVKQIVLIFLLGAGAGALAGYHFAQRGVELRIVQGRAQAVEEAQRQQLAGSPAAGRKQQERFPLTGDAAADFRSIVRLSDVDRRTTALRELLQTLSPAQVVELNASMEQFAKDNEDQDVLGGQGALLAALEITTEHAVSTDPQGVLAELAKSNAANKQGEFGLSILRLWAARDPEAAKAYFTQQHFPDGEARAAAASAMVREMVKTDPEGTFRWLRGLKADFSDEVALGALQTLSHYDAQKAGQLLALNADLPKAPEAVGAMAEGWARTEPAKALEWALTFSDELAAGGVATACSALAGKDFPAALQAAEGLTGAKRAAAVRGLAQGGKVEQMQTILPLVEGLPESADRTAAVGSMMGNWVKHEPEAASAWLAKQPVGDSRDQGVMALSLVMLKTEPDSALEWAATISSLSKRQQSTDGLIKNWLESEPTAARAWVQQSPRLSAEDRTRLLGITGR